MKPLDLLIVIPARKNSSFKGKNLYPVHGKPLIEYTFNCTDINVPTCKITTIVSTDDPWIARKAREHELITHERPARLASDSATLDSLMSFIATEEYPCHDYYVCLPPTSPLRTRDHVKLAIQQLIIDKADSLTSVTPEFRSIWKYSTSKYSKPLVLREKNRQQVRPVFIGNGAIFVTSGEILRKYRKRTGGRVSLFVMNPICSVDVHNEDDIKLAEFYLNARTHINLRS